MPAERNRNPKQNRPEQERDHHDPQRDPQPEQPVFDPQDASLLDWQRAIGNQGIQRALAQGALRTRRSGDLIQAKLTVGAPDDVYEQEADDVAQSVMRMPDAAVQRAEIPEEEELQMKRIQRAEVPEEEELQMKRIQRAEVPEEEELQMKRIQRAEIPEEEELQMKRIQRDAVGGVPEVTEDIEGSIEGQRGGGQGMPDSAREFFEPRFGQDFSGVQIHTGKEADTLNRQLDARAFTTGSDIFFRDGEYNPESSGGRELLAHELTHVVQQGASVQREPEAHTRGTAAPDDLLSREPLGPQVPEQVDPARSSTSFSFNIPGGKALTSDWNDLSTTSATNVTLAMTPTGLRVSFSPALLIDTQYPVSDIEWSGLNYEFSSGALTISLSDTQSLAPFSGQSSARKSITDTFMNAIKGTRMAVAGYDPLTDTDLMGTFEAIKTNWLSAPSSGGEVGAGDLGSPTVSASVALKSQIREAAGEGGISANGTIGLDVHFAGSVKDLAEDTSRRISTISIRGDSIIVEKKGDPVAKLKGISIAYGGAVTVTDMELLGDAALAQGAEGLGLLGLLALALSAGSPEDRLAVADKNLPSPHIVSDLARKQIEEALTNAVRQMIRDACYAIPGVNLGTIFGVQAMGDFPPPAPGVRAG
ncbi:MAG: DUF4157 domain-containing protein [Anaerolineae bacterium]|nr:DUF4157 domain-containing protein [Anaerolineae bacterium]